MRLWIISVHTKYGTDVVLVNQETEPTSEELEAVVNKFKNDFDMHDSVHADVECGHRDISEIPTSVREYLNHKIAKGGSA